MNRFVVFISVVLAIYALMNFVAFKWFRFMFHFSGKALVVVFWLIMLTQPLGQFLMSTRPGKIAAAIIQIGYVWLGLLFYFTLLGIVTKVFTLIIRKTFANHSTPVAIEKLDSGFPTAGSIILVILTISVGVGFVRAWKPIVRNVTVSLPLQIKNPLTIVQLSDLHLDELRSVKWWESIVDRTLALNPDVIVLTGDNIDENPGRLERFKPGLKRLSASYGVFAITGNHEFFTDTSAMAVLLEECGIKLLRNQVYTIPEVACIIGIDDPTGISIAGQSRPDFSELGRSVPSDIPVIALNHQPVYLQQIAEMGAHIQLSGHTHNGQLRPFDFFTRLMFPYNNGYYNVDGLHLYVSSGTGIWGPPFRIGTVSEIIELQIISSAS
ncbi:MAG: metallophosphoesterase [bacterium]